MLSRRFKGSAVTRPLALSMDLTEQITEAPEAELFRHSPLDEHVQGLATFRDPFYGEVRVFTDPASKTRIAVREFVLEKRKEALEAARLASARWTLLHENLVPLLDFSLKKQINLCAKLFVLRLFYDFHRVDLRNEIDLRRQTRSHFSPGEMTRGMYHLLRLMSFLQDKGVAHGRLSGHALITQGPPFSLRVKFVFEGFLSPDAYLARQKARLTERQGFYCSPELYRALFNGGADYICDPFVEDSFALGMILLEMGTLHPLNACYLEKGGFSRETLQNLLEVFSKHYCGESMILVSIVEFLLLKQMEERQSFAQLLEMLPSFGEVEKYLKTTQSLQIASLQQFSAFQPKLENVPFENAEKRLPPSPSLEQHIGNEGRTETHLLFSFREGQDFSKAQLNSLNPAGKSQNDIMVGRSSESVQEEKYTAIQNPTRSVLADKIELTGRTGHENNQFQVPARRISNPLTFIS